MCRGGSKKSRWQPTPVICRSWCNQKEEHFNLCSYNYHLEFLTQSHRRSTWDQILIKLAKLFGEGLRLYYIYCRTGLFFFSVLGKVSLLFPLPKQSVKFSLDLFYNFGYFFSQNIGNHAPEITGQYTNWYSLTTAKLNIIPSAWLL